jgi:uncharacterized protein YcfJ
MSYRITGPAALFAAALAVGPALAQTTVVTPQEKKQETGAAAGAISGGTAGAVGGALVGGPVGAAVGGVAGAAAGAISGAAVGSISPEDRVYVQRYTTTRQVPSVRYEREVAVGTQLPGSVTYYTFEDNPRLANYRYTRVNDRTVVVDQQGRIISIIE